MRFTTAVACLLSCSVAQARVFADTVTQAIEPENDGLAVGLASSQHAAAKAAAAVVHKAPAVEKPMGTAAVGLRASGIRRGQDDPVTLARKLAEDEEMEEFAADLEKFKELEEEAEQLRGSMGMKPGVPEGALLVKHDGRQPEIPDKMMSVPPKPAGLKPIDEILHKMADENTLNSGNLKLDRDGKPVEPTLPPAPDQADMLVYYEQMAAFHAIAAVIDDFDIDVPIDATSGLPVMPAKPKGPIDSKTKIAYDKAVAAYYKKRPTSKRIKSMLNLLTRWAGSHLRAARRYSKALKDYEASLLGASRTGDPPVDKRESLDRKEWWLIKSRLRGG
jgi:hypothetical protein